VNLENELTDTGVFKLARAYEKGTQRIREHFVNVLAEPADPAKLKEALAEKEAA